eukprot:9507534-Ditylum_brightwellii.AAC.1
METRMPIGDLLQVQCGSLNSKGCPDANFSLRSTLQIQREHDIATHVLFVDLVKAFDLVNHKFYGKYFETRLRKFYILLGFTK